jgi:hypothetical protein
LLTVTYNGEYGGITLLISLIATGCALEIAMEFSGKTQGKTPYDADM